MKKLLCMLLALTVVLVAFAGIASAEEAATWKIAIMTGTTSQGEEEFRAAEALKEKYPDNVITDTYPDQFMAEQETTIAKLTAFAADPDVKAIVMCQAVPGATPAFQRLSVRWAATTSSSSRACRRKTRPSSPRLPTSSCTPTRSSRATPSWRPAPTGASTCSSLYSFPRHMAMELIVGRHDLMVENAAALGIEFVDVTAPDPTAEAGATASQQFILEDVPQQLAKYEGKKVAFFTTNCGMQEALQTAVLDQPNAYYPQPCCPSPYHAFPATLGLEFEIGADDEAALQAIAAALAEHDAVGRYSTWPHPVNMALVNVARVCQGWIEGTITERNDAEALNDLFAQTYGEGVATIENYTNAEGTTFDNYYTVMLTPVDFNDYLVEDAAA